MTKRLRRFGLVFAWLAVSLPAVAQTSGGASPGTDAATSEATEGGAGAAAGEKSPTVCELIDQAARTHGIPVDFFTRLVW